MLTKSKNVQDSTKQCTVLKNAVLRRRGCAGTSVQLDQMAKTRQKLNLQNS